MGDCLHHHNNEDIVLFTGNRSINMILFHLQLNHGIQFNRFILDVLFLETFLEILYISFRNVVFDLS